MSEWKEYKLGEIASFQTGKLNSNEAVENGLYPFFTCSPVTLRINACAYDQKAILLAGNNAEGNFSIKYYEGKFNAYQRTYIIKSNEEICDLKFLFYSLKICLHEFKNISQGTSTRFLTAAILNNFVVPLPSLEEQKRIAGVLSSLDDKIDLLNRENVTLEALAETLFRHYFIENPDPTWKEGKLGDEFDFTMGQSPSGDSFNEDGFGIPMYQGNADFGFRFPTRRVYTTAPTRFAEENDTLISVRAPVGAQNMASERCCIGRGVAAFRHNDKSLYSYTYYKVKSLLEEIRQFNDNGTVFGSISKSDFENIDIVIPNRDSIVSFQKQALPIDKKIRTNYKQILVLSAQRDSLLPRLMSGEVKVTVQ
ncbi:MAG: restriction endonuclease subunit S [Bacteroidales bacterium]|nr:restriction endonuclease subunit S [Bacteroidales bacterium]